MNRQELFTAFTCGWIVEIKGVRGVIQSIEREDGSGRSFNVTIQERTDSSCVNYVSRKVHLYTNDSRIERRLRELQSA